MWQVISRTWKSWRDLGLEVAQALLDLPLYVKAIVGLALSAWIILVANWTDVFPVAPALQNRIEKRAETEDAQAAKASPETKVNDRLPSQDADTGLKGPFIIDNPQVGPDGSITGENRPSFFLSEIKPFTSKDVCVRASGERWACGLHAYATLRNTIAHKTIQCRNDGSPTDPQISCQMDGQNLALVLVSNGLVELKEPVSDSTLLRAQAQAKMKKVGIWDRASEF